MYQADPSHREYTNEYNLNIISFYAAFVFFSSIILYTVHSHQDNSFKNLPEYIYIYIYIRIMYCNIKSIAS